MADLESAFLRVQDCMKVESVMSVLVPSIAGHDQNSARHHLLHSLSSPISQLYEFYSQKLSKVHKFEVYFPQDVQQKISVFSTRHLHDVSHSIQTN
jgi:hypothetical protein